MLKIRNRLDSNPGIDMLCFVLRASRFIEDLTAMQDIKSEIFKTLTATAGRVAIVLPQSRSSPLEKLDSFKFMVLLINRL